MDDGIFVIAEDRMKVLRRTTYDDDAVRQLLPMVLEQFPEVIEGASPLRHRRLLLVRRHGPMNGVSAPTGSLYVDSDAVPVLVEIQPSVDTNAGREALGRALVRIASGGLETDGWHLREIVALTHVGRDEAVVLADALGWEGDPETFWAQVESNLVHSRFRLVLVTDRLVDDTLRVIEFLDQQLRDVEVIGVELPLYGSGPTRAFVPRTSNETSSPIEQSGSAAAGRHRQSA